MTKLLPCPFCGEKAKLIKHWFLGNKVYSVECKKTFWGTASHIVETSRFGTEEEAINEWNTRAENMIPEGYFLLPEPQSPVVEVSPDIDIRKNKLEFIITIQKQAIEEWAKRIEQEVIDALCEARGYIKEKTCNFEYDRGVDGYICSVCKTINSFDDFNYCPNCGAKVIR